MSFACALFATIALSATEERTAYRFNGPEKAFEALVAETTRLHTAYFDKIAAAYLKPREQGIGTSALAAPTAITVAKRVQAAIKTSQDGAEAGVSVALLRLFDIPASGDVQLSVAALEGSATQLGASASYDLGALEGPPRFQDLGLKACPYDLQDDRQRLEKLRSSYVIVCEQLIKALPSSAETAGARGYCGYEEGSQPLSFSTAAVTLQRHVSDSISAAQRSELQALLDYRDPVPDACVKDQLPEALLRFGWTRFTQQVGAGGSVTTLPLHFGFEPDTPLSKGEWKAVDARASYSLRVKYVELSASAGWSRSRDDLASPLRSTLDAAASASIAVLSLSPMPLYENGTLPSLPDGELPPRLVIGMDLAGKWAVSGPASQQGPTSFDVGVHVDLRFTSELAVRLGVPLHGELATRESDGQSGFVWSVPTFVTTVLELK